MILSYYIVLTNTTFIYIIKGILMLNEEKICNVNTMNCTFKTILLKGVKITCYSYQLNYYMLYLNLTVSKNEDNFRDF